MKHLSRLKCIYLKYPAEFQPTSLEIGLKIQENLKGMQNTGFSLLDCAAT